MAMIPLSHALPALLEMLALLAGFWVLSCFSVPVSEGKHTPEKGVRNSNALTPLDMLGIGALCYFFPHLTIPLLVIIKINEAIQ